MEQTEKTNVQNVEVNNFPWIIKDFRNKSQLFRTFTTEGVNLQNRSFMWYIREEKNIVTFQVDLYGTEKKLPRQLKVKLIIGTIDKQKVFSESIKAFGLLEYSIKRKCLLPLLSPDGTLHVNLQIKLLSSSIEKKSIRDGRNFKSFFNNRALSDVVFQFDEYEIPAHKIVLASVSPFFNELFSHKPELDLKSIVEMKGTDPNVFKEFLSFIYTGQVAHLENVAFDLYDLANKYNVPDLQTICEKRLDESLLVDNVINVLQLAHCYNSVDLKNHCIEYIDSHFEEVRETEPFKNLEKELLMDLFCAIRMKKARN